MHMPINESLHVEDSDRLLFHDKLLRAWISVNEPIFGVLVLRTADEGSRGHEQLHAMLHPDVTNLVDSTVARFYFLSLLVHLNFIYFQLIN